MGQQQAPVNQDGGVDPAAAADRDNLEQVQDALAQLGAGDNGQQPQVNPWMALSTQQQAIPIKQQQAVTLNHYHQYQ